MQVKKKSTAPNIYKKREKLDMSNIYWWLTKIIDDIVTVKQESMEMRNGNLHFGNSTKQIKHACL
uniref:Uncharacterized protein n=1 Tax=Oryza brachyantha TaxID=4533 RepID=J3LV09_ORYBR